MAAESELATTVCSSIWAPLNFFLSFCCNRGDYFYTIKTHIESLQAKLQDLMDLMQNIENKRIQLTPKQACQIRRWLNSVKRLKERANETVKEAEIENQKKTVRFFCPAHCCSFNGLQTKLSLISEEVDQQIQTGNNFESEIYANLSEDTEKSVQGFSLLRDSIYDCVKNTSVQIIGLYDVEGEGKTNLFNAIDEKINDKKDEFGSVIRVGLKKELGDTRKVQDAIFTQLKISNRAWGRKSEDERAVVIYKVLREKRFVLLLDDLTEEWQLSNLLNVGVPLIDNENRYKVIFTATSKEACRNMRADVFVPVETPNTLAVVPNNLPSYMRPNKGTVAGDGEWKGRIISNLVDPQDSKSSNEDPRLEEPFTKNGKLLLTQNSRKR